MTEQVTEALGAPKEGCCNVLLAHNPVYFDTYAAWGADLTLSGHLHGGIVRLPLLGGVISPQMKLFPDYTRGCYTKENHRHDRWRGAWQPYDPDSDQQSAGACGDRRYELKEESLWEFP